ncbi:unnamed protein product [Sympodiomycopsis kandeliae]
MSESRSNENVLRPLGLHERYSVARSSVGFPPILCYVAKVGKPIDDVYKLCSQRIEILLRREALLSCYIYNQASNCPRFAQGNVKIEDILTMHKGDNDTRSMDEVLSDGVNPVPNPHLADISTSGSPLWKVKLSHSAEGGDTTVVLILHHAICDGRGAANLFEFLLTDKEGQEPPTTASPVAPACDDLLSIKPSISYLLPILFREMVVPRFVPKFLQSYLLAAAPWPSSERTKTKLLDSEKGIKRLVFANAIPVLKAKALEKGVKTINTVVHTAALVTSYIVVRGKDVSPAKVKLGSDTAMNLRTEAGANVDGIQGGCSGNYVASLMYSVDVSAHDDFWELSRRYAQQMTSPQMRSQAQQTMGLLGYLPNGEYNADFTIKPVSTWESWLYSKATAEHPFDASFALSNVGRLDFPVESRVTDAAWCQRPSASFQAFHLDACGLGEDLSVVIGWQRDCLGIEAEEKFVRVFEKVIGVLMDSQAVTTVQDVLQRVSS